MFHTEDTRTAKQPWCPSLEGSGMHFIQLCQSTSQHRPFLYLHWVMEAVRNPAGSTKASPSHYPTLSRHFSCISVSAWPRLILSNADTGQRLLAEAERTVSVKWEQRFLRNHHLTDEADGAVLVGSHYFWWGQSLCRDGAVFVWAVMPSGQNTKPTRNTQTLQMMDVKGKISKL